MGFEDTPEYLAVAGANDGKSVTSLRTNSEEDLKSPISRGATIMAAFDNLSHKLEHLDDRTQLLVNRIEPVLGAAQLQAEKKMPTDLPLNSDITRLLEAHAVRIDIITQRVIDALDRVEL